MTSFICFLDTSTLLSFVCRGWVVFAVDWIVDLLNEFKED